MYNIDWEEAHKEYESGLGSVELSKKYGVSSFCVGYHFKRLGYKIRGNSEAQRVRNGTDNIDWAEAHKEYESGFSMRELGKKYGVGEGTVGYHFKRLGYKTRSNSESTMLRHGTDDIDWEKAYKEYQSGVLPDKLGKIYGRTRSSILFNFKRLGYKVRGVSEAQRLKHGIDGIDWGKAYKEYQSGVSLRQVGCGLGLSKSSVGTNFRRLGYKVRSTSESNNMRIKLFNSESEYVHKDNDNQPVLFNNKQTEPKEPIHYTEDDVIEVDGLKYI